MISPCFFLELHTKESFKGKKNIDDNLKLLKKTAEKNQVPVIAAELSENMTEPVLKALKEQKKKKILNVIVYGSGLDCGIETIILMLLEFGFQIWLPVDAVCCADEKKRERILIELRKKGVQMWNTEAVVAKC